MSLLIDDLIWFGKSLSCFSIKFCEKYLPAVQLDTKKPDNEITDDADNVLVNNFMFARTEVELEVDEIVSEVV